MRRSQRGTHLNWTASQLDSTPLQPLLSPFIPVPSYVQHLLMPTADPHWGDTLNGSLIRILVTLGHARNTAIPVTSSRMGFRALSSLPFLKHAHSWACPLTLHPSSSDHTYATIFTVNRFSKDFSSGRMWWSRKGPRICWGRWVFCLSHLRFVAAVRCSLGISRGLCRWLLD